MKVSVIIVNYNVCELLTKCLHSVYTACENIASEIFVVDNNSSDHSVKMVKQNFPQVHLIENKQNLGFSKANNQAITLAKGEYILLLNPDTVIQPDTITKTLAFMQQHTDAGVLGVKLLNGNGVFLPESKRGLPTPLTAFFYFTGISKIFPKSKHFNKYHLGHLDNDKVQQVEILSGAFMLIPQKVLNTVGFLDESFFMYAEDIDLSYRILKAGYHNYYYPLTSVIHYKGQSTNKSESSYVNHFYGSMIIFYKKHFMKNKFSIPALFVITAIKAIALLSRMKLFLKK